MSFGKSKTVDRPQYEKFKDTPWITQAREIADLGGKGVLSNYNKVNVFDEDTKASLNARNNAIYKRAFDNMERAYTDTMNKYNARNYGQFGTLNATAPSYITDQYQRDYQRQMDDLAYNKAANYENLINNELQRRYNTLDMFSNMYGYGQIPHNVDIANWNTENTNKDIAYANQVARLGSGGGGWQGALTGGLQGATSGFLATGNPWGALGGGIAGAVGGYM